MSFARSCSLTVLSLALGLPSLALAHTGIGHGFMQGVAHPIGGVDHLLAMVAVGLLAGRADRAALWQIPASFIALMAGGTLIGMTGISLPFIEAGIALSIVTFGLMLASKRNPTLLLTTFAVGFFALFHGHAHGTEVLESVSGVAYVAGLLSMSSLLHGCGAVVSMLLTRMHQDSALRFSGSALAVAGAGLFAVLL